MLRTILILVLFLFPTSLHAETYKWMDDNGVLNFSDSPPTNPEYLKNITVIKEIRHFKEVSKKINISIIKDNFIPVEMAVAARHDPNHKISLFSKNPFKELDLPNFQGEEQFYGSLRLGTKENNLFPFVIDVIGPGQARCYFDVNQNNDLTEDSDMFSSKGKNIFAFKITMPFQSLSEEASFTERYRLWLFTNSSLWEKRQVMYYSKTQFKGYANLGNVGFDAYLVDFGKNDASFTNDGICLDMDKNNKIKFQSECFLSDTPIIINNKKYFFEVTW